VAGDGRLRLFCGFRLPEAALDALVAWGVDALPRGRVVQRANLHVTLAFLGSRPAADAVVVGDALRAAASGAGPIRFAVERYRETRSVGMVVLDDLSGEAVALAGRLHGLLEDAGVFRRETRPWLPHVTVVRFRERPRLRPGLPRLAPFSPSDAALYNSVLRSTGAQYEVLDTAHLGIACDADFRSPGSV
jgi:2'-5' RNA ligase